MTYDQMSDISRVLVLIRSDILFEYVPPICESLAAYFANTNAHSNGESSIRAVISRNIDYEALVENNHLKWEFAQKDDDRQDDGNNCYEFGNLFSYLFSKIHKLIFHHRYEQAYDLVDAIHCLPDIIQKTKNIPKMYININLKIYARKWEDREVLARVTQEQHGE